MLKVVQDADASKENTDEAAGGSLLDEIVRDGARQMLAAALQAEVAAYVERFAHEVDEHGHRLVVRNGYHEPREVVTAAGAVPVRQPRVNDRRTDEATGERARFASAILPAWARKSPQMAEVLPLLYLHGLSSSDFAPALEQFLGSAAGLSAATITRLTEQWQGEATAFNKRSLARTDYVYLWVDGIHLKVRLTQDKVCLLVMVGVRADGNKELIALDDGHRESTESWADLLRSCKRRGMRAPVLAVGDGALGFWGALREVFPTTCEQRCWFHKIANVLNALPKSAQPGAKAALAEIWNAEDREHAQGAAKAFAADYGAKWPKAVAKITEDLDVLLAFYDYPAEHWVHLRTTNPIESTFATVRLRQRVTKGPGSRPAGLAMAFKLIESAQRRWRAVNAPHLVALVRAGATCCRALCTGGAYCLNCDLLVGLDGLHVTAVDRAPDLLTVTVESAPAPTGCPACGTVAEAHSRRVVRLVDAPCFDTPVVLLWRKRRYRCGEDGCPVRTFTEQVLDLVRPRGLLTTRAARWAITQVRSEHASVQGVARQLGVRWRTVWSAIKPILAAAADDESRFTGVQTLGVDEQVWHHVSTKSPEDGGRGPKELTGTVDLTVDENGQVRARLLDLVQGRTRAAYADWLQARGKGFTAGVDVATLDPFQGYKSAIDDELADATAVLDVFHVVVLGTKCVDEVRRRVQQDTTGHRAPLYGIQNILRAGAENLTDKQRARTEKAFAAHEQHEIVDLTWQCAQKLRSAYKQADKTEGRKIAERIIDTFPTARSPRSPASAGPCARGRRRSWPTSTPAPPTAAPRR